jgi:hypothetical protein
MGKRRAIVRAEENPIGPPRTDADAAKFGLLAIGAGAGIGAALGAASNTACGDMTTAALYCGPGWGAVSGALWGTMLAGGAGLVAAAVSQPWRKAGLSTAGLGLGAFLTLGLVSATVRVMKKA